MSYKKYQLTVRPLEIADFDGFTPIGIQTNELDGMRQIFANGFPPHQGMALDAEGNRVLMFGFYEIGPKVFEMWTIFSEDWNKTLYPAARKWMNDYCNKLEYDRLQHMVEMDRSWMDCVLGYLGFNFEKQVHVPEMGRDVFMYARVK